MFIKKVYKQRVSIPNFNFFLYIAPKDPDDFHGSWLTCPPAKMKPLKCTPLEDRVHWDKSIDRETGESVAVELNGIIALTFKQAVHACKDICKDGCTGFHLKRRAFYGSRFKSNAGYTCEFFKSVIDNKHCRELSEAELDMHMGEGRNRADSYMTTFMKYSYGDCQTGSDEQCCDENYLK